MKTSDDVGADQCYLQRWLSRRRFFFRQNKMTLSAPQLIHALMPHKEHYTTQNAGAVAMVCRDMIAASAYGDKVHVFGRVLTNDPVTTPYTALKPQMSILFGNNLGLARAYLNHLKTVPKQPDLIEVHGRCQVAAYIAKRRPDLKIVLILHNDPREMKGARSPADRRFLARHLSGVFAVSAYLMSCFEDGLNDHDLSGLTRQITPHGVDLIPSPEKIISTKKNTIVITGRMVPEKGILEAAHALVRVLPGHPDWTAHLIGAKHFAEAGASPYEKAVAKALSPLGDQVKSLGFVPLDVVRGEQADAAIAIVPSIWQEPAGRVVLEALASGCALITTMRGGIPEYAEGRSLMLNEATPEAIAAALETLITDNEARLALQRKAVTDYSHTLAAAGKALDDGRMMVSKTLNGLHDNA
jgi:glycosyltransferase involved in cell wall biosynthesis